jgi:AmmeMemoRadiSam system protein A
MLGTLNVQQAKVLLEHARQTIAAKLEGKSATTDTGVDPVFKEWAATFVTLKIDGQLRGCIGNLEPVGTIWDSIRDNARNAAFQDYRFSPLTSEEMSRVHIDISILSKPVTLQYTDGEELLARLRPGVDGVILRHGRSGATFLPQVWRQLPDPTQFLGHLCRKAELAENCWRTQHPEIQIYQVQCIAE